MPDSFRRQLTPERDHLLGPTFYINVMEPIRIATEKMFDRYLKMLEDSPGFGLSRHPSMSRDHLIWMCETAIDKIDTWPVDKLNRWLGFVQGIMCVQHIITVEEEREVSRPVFGEAYAAMNIDTPEIVNP